MRKNRLSFQIKFACCFFALPVFSISASEQNTSSPTNYLIVPSLSRCLVDVPKFKGDRKITDSSNYPLDISSKKLTGVFPKKVIYSGAVKINQGNRFIESDKASLKKQGKNSILDLTGHLNYQDESIKLDAKEGHYNLEDNHLELEQVNYQYVERLGRGTAKKSSYTDKRYITLTEASFSSCPVGDESWSISGSTIQYDDEEELITIDDAIFKIKNVPVFYLPYFQLPTTDKRRTGILKPQFSYDGTDGMEMSIPFYWNIATNYDDTFTPKYIEKRGFLLQNEFRYLNSVGNGTLATDWLPTDKLYDDGNTNRWLLYWNQNTMLNPYWNFSSNVTKVSDNDYLSDIDSQWASSTSGYLQQQYKIRFNDDHWDMNLYYRSFQSLTTGVENSLYYVAPQLNVNYYNSLNAFNFHVFSQVSHFSSEEDNNPNAWRFHLEPSVNYKFMLLWFNITPEAALLMTHYNQNIPAQNTDEQLAESVTRVIPTTNVDVKMTLEKQYDNGVRQTIEPRVKYTYTSYRDQSDINNFDSALLQANYFEMFRSRSYSGYDRISSENKLAMGITSRFYDEEESERLSFSVGQIYYLQAPKTGDMNSRLDQNSDIGKVSWAGDLFYYINDHYILRSGIQYDTRINRVALANSTFEYRGNSKELLQLSYRYASKNYIDNLGLDSNIEPYNQDISQLGAIGSYPLTDSLSAVAGIYYNTTQKINEDSFVGLAYSDCCWGINVEYGRKVTGWDQSLQKSQFSNKFSINFELRGLGIDSNPVARMLNFGILPYKSTF